MHLDFFSDISNCFGQRFEVIFFDAFVDVNGIRLRILHIVSPLFLQNSPNLRTINKKTIVINSSLEYCYKLCDRLPNSKYGNTIQNVLKIFQLNQFLSCFSVYDTQLSA